MFAATGSAAGSDAEGRAPGRCIRWRGSRAWLTRATARAGRGRTRRRLAGSAVSVSSAWSR